MRLAYADPPYPGYAHLYPENEEVDHAELIAQLVTYDGWALSTNETTLQYVLGLCPPNVRVLAWCKLNAPPIRPNPVYSWEPVILKPARAQNVTARSFMVGEVPVGFMQKKGLVGQKSEGFCDWVLRCLGAEPGDELDDLYPGTGVMGRVWARYGLQPRLFPSAGQSPRSGAGLANMLRRSHTPLPGMDVGKPIAERKKKAERDRSVAAPLPSEGLTP